ncbi:hypothetical protein INR49_004871, partial [Caranx melampygus]
KIDFSSMHFTHYLLVRRKTDIPKDIREDGVDILPAEPPSITQFYWGSELDENLSHHNGNSEPRGFGHIGIAVPDIDAACKLFEELGDVHQEAKSR